MNVYLVKVRAEYTDILEVEAETPEEAAQDALADASNVIDTIDSDLHEYTEVIEVTEA